MHGTDSKKKRRREMYKMAVRGREKATWSIGEWWV